MTEAVALEATGVFKRYGAREALRGVDLVAVPGEVHGLLGPNGAGKTTLMRLVLGLARADAGTVRVLGEQTRGPGGRLPEGAAGFVEAPGFYPYLTGRRNLALLDGLDGGRAGAKKRVAETLERVGLSGAADTRVRGYSAGMRQRLAVAAALLRSPRLLLLDEPTSSLDPAGARDLRAHLKQLAEAGAAVVLSSHDMSEVEDLCRTLTIVHEGRVVFTGTVVELRKMAPPSVHVLRTSDDPHAERLAGDHAGVVLTRLEEQLEVSASVEDLDRFVLALGAAGVAVRGLETRARSLESLFLRLTERAAAAGDAP